MATYDVTVGANTKMASVMGAKVYFLKREINIEDEIAADATLTTNAKITSADILQAIDIPKNTWVLGTFVRVVTASTDATLTVGIGDADGATSWDASVNLATTTNTMTITDAYSLAAASGKLYTSADTIDVTFNNDATNGVFLLGVMCVDVSDANDA